MVRAMATPESLGRLQAGSFETTDGDVGKATATTLRFGWGDPNTANSVRYRTNGINLIGVTGASFPMM